MELVRSSCQPKAAIARALGIASEALRAWVKQAAIHAGELGELTTAERVELGRLRPENRILHEEREILKQAAVAVA